MVAQTLLHRRASWPRSYVGTPFLIASAVLALCCSSPKVASSSGLAVEFVGDARISPEKLEELDARHAAFLECLPRALKQRGKPVVRIAGDCDRLPDGTRGRYGATWVMVPPSLGALAHELAHYYPNDPSHSVVEKRPEGWVALVGSEVRGPFPTRAEANQHLGYDRICGDAIDATFRKQHPVTCKEPRRLVETR